MYCPITNVIFQYSKINLLVKDTGTGGRGERGLPRKNATQKNGRERECSSAQSMRTENGTYLVGIWVLQECYKTLI